MSVRSTGSVMDLTALQPGDHVCAGFSSDEEHREMLTSYMQAGIARHEKVVYFGEAYGDGTIHDYLQGRGFAVQELIDSGQLVTVPARMAYIPEGGFDPATMVETFRAQTDLALSQGFSALRAAGEMSWFASEVLELDPMTAYESRADRFTASAKQVGLCMYDLRLTARRSFARVAAAHPAYIAPACDELPPACSVYASPDGDIVVDGEIDLSNVDFLELMLSAVDVSVTHPVLDLRHVTFMDIRGMRAIAAFGRALGTEGRALTVRSMPTAIGRCFSLLEFDRIPGIVVVSDN